MYVILDVILDFKLLYLTCYLVSMRERVSEQLTIENEILINIQNFKLTVLADYATVLDEPGCKMKLVISTLLYYKN